MTELLITLDIMTPLFILLGLGWLLRRINLMGETLVSGLNKLIFKLFLPVLLFNNIRTLDVSIAPGLGYSAFIFCSVLGIFLVAHFIVPKFVSDPRKQGVMVQGIFRTNFAILGIPLVQAMFGDAGI